MTRPLLPKIASAFVVLVVISANVGHADPPTLVDTDMLASAGPLQSGEPGLEPAPRPHVESYANSGCKQNLDGGSDEPCAGEDEVVLTVEAADLRVLHRNATYNCCPEDIVISLIIEENLLRLTEEETLLGGGCDCWCCYDVEALVVDLAPGTYTVEFCWFDYETWQIQCCADQIVIPEPPNDPPRGDPPVVVDPDNLMHRGLSPAPPIDIIPRPPHVEQYSHLGCLDDPNDPWLPPCGGDEIELTVEGNTLYVLHRNATYNCCLDDIMIALTVEDNWLILDETEIVPDPCYCICCYNVETTVVDLAPGTYTVEFCWYDYETDQVTCYWEDIVVD